MSDKIRTPVKQQASTIAQAFLVYNVSSFPVLFPVDDFLKVLEHTLIINPFEPTVKEKNFNLKLSSSMSVWVLT